MKPDWSNLPKDILEVVSKKITSVGDYLRFRAVCNSWRSALSPAPRHLPAQLPWLMLPYDPHSTEGNDTSLRFFYDISTNQIHRVNLPETKGKEYCGSSRGWLVLEDGPEISLLNPITRVQVQLPSLKVLPTILGVESEKIRSQLDIWPSRYGYKGDTNRIIQRIILTSSPLDSSCVVMALFKSNWSLAFCRIGDESWTLFEGPDQNTGYRLIVATYHNGLFYRLSFHQVRVYDLKGNLCELMQIEGELEDLLLVAKCQELHGFCEKDRFSIYKLGVEANLPDWIETKGTRERMCFTCEGIEQCFTFPIDKMQMLVSGTNLLCYASPFLVGKNEVDFWRWQPDVKVDYVIKMVKLPMFEVPIFSNYWNEYVIELVKSFGSYPIAYSRALWLTPSFY